VLDTAGQLRRWQTATASALLVGYAGYYLCRSNLSVAAPLLIAEFGASGLDKAGIGAIASVGALAYALGKLVTGVAGDRLGGRPTFITAMAGSVLATAAFGASAGVSSFMALWAVNRFIQAAGWNALVKIAAHWFPPHRRGAIMGVLSLSFLFGDGLVRVALGALIDGGAGWRAVFFTAAGGLAGIAIAAAAILRSSPTDRGLPEPGDAASSLLDETLEQPLPTRMVDTLWPHMSNRTFWLVCAMSFGLTLVREAFSAWTPMYLVEAHGLMRGDAARLSSVFPFAGGISVLAVGALSDRWGNGNRVAVAVPFLVAAVPALAALGAVRDDAAAALWLLSVCAFLVIGPYSLLAGAMAIDIGGKRGSSTAAGLIDTSGYIGAVASGYVIGILAQGMGWGVAFNMLAAVTATTCVAAVVCWRQQRPAIAGMARMRRA
jgi:OPA family glycerol-3-phosphate transporter-like MFS transporter